MNFGKNGYTNSKKFLNLKKNWTNFHKISIFFISLIFTKKILLKTSLEKLSSIPPPTAGTYKNCKICKVITRTTYYFLPSHIIICSAWHGTRWNFKIFRIILTFSPDIQTRRITLFLEIRWTRHREDERRRKRCFIANEI